MRGKSAERSKRARGIILAVAGMEEKVARLVEEGRSSEVPKRARPTRKARERGARGGKESGAHRSNRYLVGPPIRTPIIGPAHSPTTGLAPKGSSPPFPQSASNILQPGWLASELPCR
ncbi:hypothetical protein KM043_002816 [Ampulex compressa]|nr:hypothetical protein KM043_002816 [Ampulex compressa]